MNDTEMVSEQLPAAQKKWRPFGHYVIEFIMIVLAVTVGFFVDDFRESRAERGEEIDYMRSLLVDLRLDRAQFELNTRHYPDCMAGYDSVIGDLKKLKLHGNESWLYYNYLRTNFAAEIYYYDRTVSQLKGSGKFRVIENQKVSDALLDYDNYILTAMERKNSPFRQSSYEICSSLSIKVFDGTDAFKYIQYTWEDKDFKEIPYPVNMRLLSYDKTLMLELASALASSRWFDWDLFEISIRAHKRNLALDSLIRKEYKIESQDL